MPQCIFCKSDAGGFSTREHILPESLGGGDWALLPNGLFCDRCQNRFGSEIEQKALADYPFSFLRVFLGIPTKKRKAPWFESWEGKVRSALTPGRIGYDPAPPFEAATDRSHKTQLRLLAYPNHPQMICRTLLKMGIEVVANDDQVAVFHERYDAARIFALEGRKTADWWYLQYEDMNTASRCMIQGVSAEEWQDGVRLSVNTIEEDAEVFHLHLLYLDLMVPLDPRIQAPVMAELPEPEYRLFLV